jgi:hypothetical protein
MTQDKAPNPFYFLLLLASLLFVATALAYGVVPALEERAPAVDQRPPPSFLVEYGPTFLFCELGAMVVFAVLSMGLDRIRSLRKERSRGSSLTNDQLSPPK